MKTAETLFRLTDVKIAQSRVTHRRCQECKATTGNAKSMRTVLEHPEKYHVANALKLGDYNIGRSGQLLTMPMYMGFLLTEV